MIPQFDFFIVSILLFDLQNQNIIEYYNRIIYHISHITYHIIYHISYIIYHHNISYISIIILSIIYYIIY